MPQKAVLGGGHHQGFSLRVGRWHAVALVIGFQLVLLVCFVLVTRYSSCEPAEPVEPAEPHNTISASMVVDEGSDERDAVIHPAAVQAIPERRRKVIYLHFNKAGGTSMCGLFQQHNMRTLRGCNCVHTCGHYLLHSHAAGDGGIRAAKYESCMEREGLDVCAVEHMELWPRPELLLDFAAAWNGHLAIMLRDPWLRFVATFHASNFFAKSSHTAPVRDVEEFARRGDRFTISWGSYHRPNFYVRFLNGLGSEYLEVGERELDTAKRVLRSFSCVLILDQSDSPRFHAALANLMGMPGESATLPHRNSGESARLQEPRPTDHYRGQFEMDNTLDRKLYEWALQEFEDGAPQSACL
eukprot:TRINITY_DN2966_c0_g1_i1.p1 TRINITY_DN2966_c0_g1~~TRINITY_DN2966_c0_g1_i1.p1  ORF type:complete len:355 (+),score=34.03 TRINITY_DN2966_c0_g1_i1:245-1309(+)